ncbi:mating-type alpha-pheromone receptor [Neofusicoccum parvum]|uniref:Mating-type alpha-pheromone receptor n=1 Tax=Neofusicoccum parvum TaxID=310453 RepID=A0ACB5SA44_9PEZI|nr:mating-type alpha-pheromone receptor [Neofusicoccum parvum]
MSATNHTAPGFNVYQQNLTFYTSGGQVVKASLSEVNSWVQYGIRTGIIRGSQIGASFILLILLLILTKPEKRRSPIFIFNTLALVLCVARAVFGAMFFTGGWYDFYAAWSFDTSAVAKQDYAFSILTVALTLILAICVEISLMMQSYIVCTTVKGAWRMAVIVVSVLVALTAVGVRFVLAVYNCMDFLGYTKDSSWMVWSIYANITLCISICWFSLIFCSKLGLAIRNRRNLGLTQFGPMQIVFIMGAQTMTVPVLPFFLPNVPELESVPMTVVSLFLPLSSIWAATSTDGRGQASRGQNARHKLLGKFSWNKFAGGRKASHMSESSTAPLQDPISPSSKKTTFTCNTDKTTATSSSDRTYLDLENDDGSQVFGSHCQTILEKGE